MAFAGSDTPIWDGIKVSSIDELKNLGSSTIQGLMRYEAGIITLKRQGIQTLERHLDFLEGKTISDIKQISKGFENVKLNLPEVRIDPNDGEAVPIAEVDVLRRNGTTNFNNCGWCEYGHLVNGSYGFMSTGSCGFLSLAEREEERPRGILSECSVTDMMDIDLKEMTSIYKTKIQIMKHQIAERKDIILQLKSMEKETEYKPCVPPMRGMRYFKPKDPLAIYVAENPEVDASDSFILGKVDRIDNDNGLVYAKLVNPYKTLRGVLIEDMGNPIGNPAIMKLDEAKYLAKNSEFFDMWVRYCNMTPAVYAKFSFHFKMSAEDGLFDRLR